MLSQKNAPTRHVSRAKVLEAGRMAGKMRCNGSMATVGRNVENDRHADVSQSCPDISEVLTSVFDA